MSGYGATPTRPLIGLDAFKQHDPNSTWTDAGQGQGIIDRHAGVLEEAIVTAIDIAKAGLGNDTSHLVAAQVAEAIMEYASTANFSLGLVDDHVAVQVELANEAAAIRMWIPLLELLQTAQRQAASDPAFRESMLKMLHGAIGQATGTIAARPAVRSGRAARPAAMEPMAVVPPQRPAPRALNSGLGRNWQPPGGE